MFKTLFENGSTPVCLFVCFFLSFVVVFCGVGGEGRYSDYEKM